MKRFPDVFSNNGVHMLDIGGGSGAFAIQFCKANANNQATVLDLPAVIDAATVIIADLPETDVNHRITLLPVSATDSSWNLQPDGNAKGETQRPLYDVVFISYTSGSVPEDELTGIYQRSFDALKPGGSIVLHDFMVPQCGRLPT